jgi:hypothetical protein
VSIQVIRHVFEGLRHLHKYGRLHQSLGPSSVILSTVDERNSSTLAARLRDLAFSVDITDEALYGGATLAEIYDYNTVMPREARPECATAVRSGPCLSPKNKRLPCTCPTCFVGIRWARACSLFMTHALPFSPSGCI